MPSEAIWSWGKEELLHIVREEGVGAEIANDGAGKPRTDDVAKVRVHSMQHVRQRGAAAALLHAFHMHNVIHSCHGRSVV